MVGTLIRKANVLHRAGLRRVQNTDENRVEVQQENQKVNLMATEIKYVAPRHRGATDKGIALARAIEKLFDETEPALNRTTDVMPEEMPVIALGQAIADEIDSDFRRAFWTRVKELRVSEERQGRREIVDIVNERSTAPFAPSLWDKLMGKTGEEEEQKKFLGVF